MGARTCEGHQMLSFDVQNSKEVCTSTTAVDLHSMWDWWQLVVVGGNWWYFRADSVT